MTEQDGRFTLYTMIPSFITFRTIFIIIMLGGVSLFGLYKQMERGVFDPDSWIWLIVSIPFAGILTAFQIYFNRGYRVSYDDEAIYMRPIGLNWKLQHSQPENIMYYTDIDHMEAVVTPVINDPFDYIHLNRANWDGDELFALSRSCLRDNELKTLLRFMYTKIPEKFSQDIIDYMNAEPGWVERKQIEAAERESMY